MGKEPGRRRGMAWLGAMLWVVVAGIGFGEEEGPTPANFSPDFAARDAYLPHLDRHYLSGWWKLKLLDGTKDGPVDDAGRKQRFFAPNHDDSAWADEFVPGIVGWPYGPASDAAWRKTFGGVAYFRRSFAAPKAAPGERIFLCFRNIIGDAEIFLDGRSVLRRPDPRRGDSTDFLTPAFEIDLTGRLGRASRHVLALRVYCDGEPVEWGRARPWGVHGDVYLEVRPPVWARAILVTPRDDLEGISFEYALDGGQTATGWRAEAFEWTSGETVARAELPPAADGRGQGGLRWENSRPWSCESPFLYGLRLLDGEGRVAGVTRFGLRTFGIRDGDFVLNGLPIALRGLTIHPGDLMPNPGRPFPFFHNEGDSLRRYLQAYKDANVNHIRVHAGALYPVAYDLFDELGFIITDELDYPSTAIKNPGRADLIAIHGLDGACDADGVPTPEFTARTIRRMEALYSRPSICTRSFGNEMRDETRTARLFENLYDLHKKIDRQNRPATLSSGRYWKNGNNLASLRQSDPKVDYLDTHDYTGTINNFPLGYCQPVGERFIQEARRHYNPLPPVVNGETVYFANHYYPGIFDPIWPSDDAPEPDWPKLLAMVDDFENNPASFPNRMMSYYWIRNWGLRNYKYRRAEGRGIYTERVLEVNRKLWPDWDGYENLSGDYFTGPTPAFPLATGQFVPNAAYERLKGVNAPVVAVFDFLPPNRFAGETIPLRVNWINNSPRDVEGTFRYGVEDAVRSVPLALKQAEKKTVDLELALPAKAGRFVLDHAIESGEGTLNRRILPLNLRFREEVFAPLTTNLKVALYDSAAATFGRLAKGTTVQLLRRFKLPFTRVEDFDGLEAYDLLIVGANAFDTPLIENAAKIRTFVENGGRLLAFEQCVSGRLPFLPELECVPAGAGQFSEILQRRHPALADMDQAEFFVWDQKDWAVYRRHLRPLSAAALLLGGDSTQWGSDRLGMVAAHLKLGKGDVLLNQAEVSALAERDSGAARFARGLLETVLDDATRHRARAFRSLPTASIPTPAAGKAVTIPLRAAANRGFVDEVAGDGRGGWSDQGPENDLGVLPTGRQVWGGVPFEIHNPSADGGMGMVVVSADPARGVPAISRPIPVGKRLKRLYFLHAGAWMPGEKETVGAYEATYASGEVVRIPLESEVNIGEWWNAPSRNMTDAACFWSGQNGSSIIGLYGFGWTNPAPDDPVASIRLIGSGKALLGLVALTGESP